MPLYDYRCESCSFEEEVLQSMNDARLTECPQCKQSSFKRKPSAPAFAFKGGGWYKDLYGSANAGGASGSGGSTTSSEPKPASTETKTAASTSESSSSSAPSAAPAAPAAKASA